MEPTIRRPPSGSCGRQRALPSARDVPMKSRTGWALGAAAIALTTLLAGACAAGAKKPDKITSELLTQPKEVLFEKGKTLIAKGRYEDGRKYLNHVFETYPNETMGREALLL